MLFSALVRGNGKTSGIEFLTSRLFHTKEGNLFVSAIFGLALAMLFQKVCKDKKCIVYESPPMEEIKENIYELEDTCYQYTPKLVKCA